MARLPVYLRALVTLSDDGTGTCSSEELAAAAGVNSAKLRKDLSYLGSYGTRGVGYDVDYLRYQIAREIGSHPGLAGRHRRHRQPRARAGQLLRLPQPGVPRRRAARRRPGAAPGGRRRRRRPTVRRPRADRGRAGRRDRRDRHPGHRRPGRRRPHGRRRHHAASSTSRRRCWTCPTASTCARSTSRSSCRSWPTTSSARPREPRHERPRRRHLPPLRARSPCSSGSPSTARARPSWCSDVAAGEHVTEAAVIATCNRLEIYADVDRFHGSVEELSGLLVERAGRVLRGAAAAPLRPLRRRCRLAPVPGGRRARLDGGGRGPDPRPDARRPGPRPGGAAPSARRSTCCSSRRSASASGCTPRPASTRPRRPWCPPRSTGSATSWAAYASWSAPARWPRSPPRRCPPRAPPTWSSSTARRDRAVAAGRRARRPRRGPRRPGGRGRRRRRRRHLHRVDRRAGHDRDGRGPRHRPLDVVDLALPHDVEPGVARAPRRHPRHPRRPGRRPAPTATPGPRSRPSATSSPRRSRRSWAPAARPASPRPSWPFGRWPPASSTPSSPG